MSQYSASFDVDTPAEQVKRPRFVEYPYALFSSDLSIYDREVYISVRSFMNRQGYAWPSIATIVKRSGISKSAVCRSLAVLEDRGWLKRMKHPTKDVTLYRIYESPDPTQDVSERDRGVSERDTTSPRERQGVSQRETGGVPERDTELDTRTRTIELDTRTNARELKNLTGEGWSEDEQYMQLLAIYPKATNPKGGYPTFKRHRSQFALMLAAAQKVQDGVKHGDDVKYVPDISRWLEEERWLAPGARSSEDYAREARREAEEQSKRDRFDALCASVVSAMDRGYTVQNALKACSVPVDVQGRVLDRVKASNAYKTAVKRKTDEVQLPPEDTTGKVAANGKRYHFIGNVEKLERMEQQGETPAFKEDR